MRSSLPVLFALLTITTTSWAKAPADCSSLLDSHVRVQPKFLAWRQLYDAIDGRGKVTLALEIENARNERHPRDLSLPFHRSMRVIEPFTVKGETHTHYVVEGDAWDWQLYARDLDRELGAPKFQVLAAEGEVKKSSLLHELTNRARWTAFPIELANWWLTEKSKTYAKVARWSDQKTSVWAERLRARRLPRVEMDAEFANRLRECSGPFCAFEPLPLHEIASIVTFLEGWNPRLSAATPGDLPKMFVNVLDRLEPDDHERHVESVEALNLGIFDVQQKSTRDDAHTDILGGLRLVHEVVKNGILESKQVPNYTIGFVRTTISLATSLLERRPNDTLRVSLEEWDSLRYGEMFFDPRLAPWSANQAVTIVSDEASDRLWAVVNRSRFDGDAEVIETLTGLTDRPLPGHVGRYLEMQKAIPAGDPAQWTGELGRRLFDWSWYFKSVARITRVGHVNDFLIVPLH